MPRAYSYIRMSTEGQLRGDSRRRQLEASEQYARDHGLELVKDFSLEDIGVSAFKGANLSAKLGLFLDAVRAGKVEPGSFLLVESLDRLTRQAITKSQTLFLGLLGAGINIVTLADQRVYQAEDPQFEDLIISLAIMSRAHEESVIKSKRLAAAWQNKRANASAKKLTSLSPAWLVLSHDRTSFAVIDKRAEIVRRIFEQSARGLGSYSIAKKLNQTSERPFGRSGGWHPSYVTKILQSRAVLGEYQPHEIKDGKRVTAGAPLPGYFPQIISDELFLRVQRSRAQRKAGAGGRRGPRISNIFSRVAKCGYCGAPMHFVNKGKGTKGGTYLVCDTSRRGLGCNKTSWSYPDFEVSFFTFVREVDLESLLHTNNAADERLRLQEKLQSIEGRLSDLSVQQETTYQLVLEEPSSNFLKNKLTEFGGLISAAESERDEIRKSLEARDGEAARLRESKDEIKDLVAKLQSNAGDDIMMLRAQTAARLASLISTLKVFPVGIGPKSSKTIEAMQEEGSEADLSDEDQESAAEVLSHIAKVRDDPRSNRRFFSVGLKDGEVRVVYPDPTDPALLDEQIHRSDEGLIRTTSDGRSLVVVGAPDRASPDSLVDEILDELADED